MEKRLAEQFEAATAALLARLAPPVQPPPPKGTQPAIPAGAPAPEGGEQGAQEPLPAELDALDTELERYVDFAYFGQVPPSGLEPPPRDGDEPRLWILTDDTAARGLAEQRGLTTGLAPGAAHPSRPTSPPALAYCPAGSTVRQGDAEYDIPVDEAALTVDMRVMYQLHLKHHVAAGPSGTRNEYLRCSVGKYAPASGHAAVRAGMVREAERRATERAAVVDNMKEDNVSVLAPSSLGVGTSAWDSLLIHGVHLIAEKLGARVPSSCTPTFARLTTRLGAAPPSNATSIALLYTMSSLRS
eukprot:jgi/Tetstr1/466540/TSEL_011044.t1